MIADVDAQRARLVRALKAYEPADADEEGHWQAILQLLRDVPRPFDRTQYQPGHLTGSAFVVDGATGRVLLHRHRRLGRWLQLGGHDEGEHDPLVTAMREAREESGITDLVSLSPGILDLDVHAIRPAGGEPAHLHFDIRYALATWRPYDITGEHGTGGIAWFGLADADRMMREPGGSRALRKLAVLLRPPPA
jgi:8-oxo-dGTP pyrophosphatase MutT (NUDIX family)